MSWNTFITESFSQLEKLNIYARQSYLVTQLKAKFKCIHTN